MSLKACRHQGRKVWDNWTRGYKHPGAVGLNTWERQKGRKEVRELKRLAHKYDRQIGKRIIEQELSL